MAEYKKPKKAVPEQSQNNLRKGKRFSSTYQPNEANRLEGLKRYFQEKKEIEKSAEILKRLLSEEITNKSTGKTLTQKEAMLYGLLVKAIKERDLKAIELILKIIGDLDCDNKNVNINMINSFSSPQQLKEARKELETNE